MELSEKVAVVTGATRGMGRATAMRLAREGARLALVARTREGLEAVAAEIKAAGGEAFAAPTDVTERRQVEHAVNQTVERFGRVDILVNCAFWGPPGSLEETTEDFWDKTLDTTLKGPYLFTRAVFPVMREQGGGRIVNIGSLAGKTGEDNRTAYCAAKWGLEGLTAALQEEMPKHHIHVHLISPAATDTSFWEPYNLSEETTGRMIPPDVIADAVAWVLKQPDRVLIRDVPVYNYRDPFEGRSSPFAD
ncbi:MAG: SDR family oxidoreductase [Anaerolineae bacterium]|jgi:3-oxoacyl-[acyl-carrier protein] reductase